MKDSIHQYFKVGLVSFMAYPSTLRGQDRHVLDWLKLTAADPYFDAIEVNQIVDAEDRAKAARLLAASHLQVLYGAQPRLLTAGLNPNALDEADRLAAEKTLIEAIDEAKQLGSRGIAFLSGKWNPETREESYAQLVKTTIHICRYAADRQMNVELEVFDFDIAKKSLIGPAPLAARFAADIRTVCPNFGLLIDLSHIPMCYESSEFVVRTLRPYLTHFHIGNTVIRQPGSDAYGDEHPRFGFPGSENDVPQVLNFLRVLRQEGFFNPADPYVLSFEVKPWQDEDPAIVVASAKRVLNQAWAILEDD
jgi:sugar phosphate isomerase/epimerase